MKPFQHFLLTWFIKIALNLIVAGGFVCSFSTISLATLPDATYQAVSSIEITVGPISGIPDEDNSYIITQVRNAILLAAERRLVAIPGPPLVIFGPAGVVFSKGQIRMLLGIRVRVGITKDEDAWLVGYAIDAERYDKTRTTSAEVLEAKIIKGPVGAFRAHWHSREEQAQVLGSELSNIVDRTIISDLIAHRRRFPQ